MPMGDPGLWWGRRDPFYTSHDFLGRGIVRKSFTGQRAPYIPHGSSQAFYGAFDNHFSCCFSLTKPRPSVAKLIVGIKYVPNSITEGVKA